MDGNVREYQSDLPGIFGKKTKIQQVLFNLFKNASQSMNAKTYTNETPKLIIRLKKGLAQVHIEVEDNGTGMGLSISYFIIADHHGGQMEVDSTPGKGTRFTVKLPFRSKNRCC